MKIVMITGSARKNGTSAALAAHFSRGALEAGHEVFLFPAAFMNVHPCLGCGQCLEKGACVFSDDMDKLNPKLLEADAVVFATPIYYYAMSADMKKVIDRFYANNSALRGDKQAVLLATMAEPEERTASGAVASFSLMAEYLGWERAGMVIGTGCPDAAALAQTEFPLQAYRLGRSMRRCAET